MKHWTEEYIDKKEREKSLSLNDVSSWLRHLLKVESERLKFCEEKIDAVVMLRAEKESPTLCHEYKTRQTDRGELKANVRGIKYVLDAFATFRRKAVHAEAPPSRSHGAPPKETGGCKP